MKKSVDEQVMELLRRVKKKKSEIKKSKKRPQWKTSCSISFDPESQARDRMNIQVKTESDIILIYAFLLQRERDMSLAAKELDLDVDDGCILTYMGYPISDWKEDLKTRASQLSINKKQQEVDALDQRVNKLVSPEQRREMELKALGQILGDE